MPAALEDHQLDSTSIDRYTAPTLYDSRHDSKLPRSSCRSDRHNLCHTASTDRPAQYVHLDKGMPEQVFTRDTLRSCTTSEDIRTPAHLDPSGPTSLWDDGLDYAWNGSQPYNY